MLLVLLAACTGKDSVVPGDTSSTVGVCGRVRGTTGILVYEDGGDTIRNPVEAPDTTSVTTGVAGPVGDELTYVAVTDGTVISTADAGCNWEAVGSLPTGDWRLRAAGTTLYAFDMDGTSVAVSDDLGQSWAPHDAGDTFLDVPTIDPATVGRLRGVQARGVVTSSDAGTSWTVDYPLPEGAVLDAAVASANLDRVLIATDTGASLSQNGGATWDVVYDTGSASAVAIHPDDAEVMWVQGPDTSGLETIWRQTHDSDWARQVDASSYEITPGMPLWPVPGDSNQVLSGGPSINDEGETVLALYVLTAGVGAHRSRISSYVHMHDVAFGPDRWVTAVDSVP